MSQPEDRKPPGWPGAVMFLGFLSFLLFIVWTVKEVLPWQ